MSIILRTHATRETRVISYEEFKERIRAGEIVPEDQVKDLILTNNEWWTVDNLRTFHRFCPIRYPSGPRLLAREKVEEEERRREEIAQAQFAKRAAPAKEFFGVEPSESGIMLVSAFERLTEWHEPPLAGYNYAVRFTYLPSLGLPLFVRVWRSGAEWKLRYGLGLNSEPSFSTLALANLQRLLNLTEAANLATMSHSDNTLPPGVHGCDGSTWLLEVARQGVYDLRHRWSPNLNAHERHLMKFVELCEHLVELSGLSPQSL